MLAKHKREYTHLISQWSWQLKQAVRAERAAARLFAMGGEDNFDLATVYRTIAERHLKSAEAIKLSSLKYLPE
ncbi:MAG: hypothetical protein WBP46_11210 [Thiolinea sp.]